MAQIITRTWLTPSTVDTQLAADLQSLFDFVRVEDGKMYLTDTMYLYMDSGTVRAKNGNNIGFQCSLTSDIDYKLIKTATGDIAFLSKDSYNSWEDSKYLRFVIVKVKNAVTGEESYGIFSPYASPSTSYIQNFGNTMLFTDDITASPAIAKVAYNPITVTNYSDFMYGANANAPITVLCNAFSHQSQCITKNLKIMLVTPRPYNGDCTIDGKKYYCISYIAMPDE